MFTNVLWGGAGGVARHAGGVHQAVQVYRGPAPGQDKTI